MDNHQTRRLNIKIIVNESATAEAITEGIKAGALALIDDGAKGCEAETYHALCHCGGEPMIESFPSRYSPGDVIAYHISCSRCREEPLFGQYGRMLDECPAHVDFPTEAAALSVWDAVMGAGLSNG